MVMIGVADWVGAELQFSPVQPQCVTLDMSLHPVAVPPRASSAVFVMQEYAATPFVTVL